MNQTRHGVSYEYPELKAKRFFGMACLRKKLGFHTEICEFREKPILKIGLFHVVKELSKSNQTWHGVSYEYLEYKAKRFFAIACRGKKN